MYTYRAQCVNVVDGDTVDLLVDLGLRQYTKTRFRLARIDTPELNSKDPAVVAKAQEAKKFVANALMPATGPEHEGFDEVYWTLRIETKKNPDNYGRWLVEIWYRPNGAATESSLNTKLLLEGLAAEYKG